MIELETYKKAKIQKLNDRLDELSGKMSLSTPGLSERNDAFAKKLNMKQFEQFRICFTEMVAIYGELDRLGGQDYTLDKEAEEDV